MAMSMWLYVFCILSTQVNGDLISRNAVEKHRSRLLSFLENNNQVDNLEDDNSAQISLNIKRRDSEFHWGYTEENGPKVWSNHFPAGNGVEQTPIDIDDEYAVYDASLTPLKWSYIPENADTLINNGHTAQLNYNETGSSLEGGPLNYTYQLAQFHFHWGKDDNSGSEHLIDGDQYPAELHMVHWNSEVFSSMGEAAQVRDGLCVLSMLMEIDDDDDDDDDDDENTELKKVTDLLSNITYNGDSVFLSQGIDPAKLLPETTAAYWTYLGSLTTPPLYESVTWIVFKDPIKVSEDQLQSFRALHEFKEGVISDDEFNGLILKNFRPTQPLGNRTVYTNEQDDNDSSGKRKKKNIERRLLKAIKQRVHKEEKYSV